MQKTANEARENLRKKYIKINDKHKKDLNWIKKPTPYELNEYVDQEETKADLSFDKEKEEWMEETYMKLKNITGFTNIDFQPSLDDSLLACIDLLYLFENKISSCDEILSEPQIHQFSKSTLRIEYKPESEDVNLGNGYIMKKNGRIYENGIFKKNTQSAGYYLVKTLKSNKNKPLGKNDFKPHNDKSFFAWSTIKKAKNTIVGCCGRIIETNINNEYFLVMDN